MEPYEPTKPTPSPALDPMVERLIAAEVKAESNLQYGNGLLRENDLLRQKLERANGYEDKADKYERYWLAAEEEKNELAGKLKEAQKLLIEANDKLAKRKSTKKGKK